jgi:hypothetical protein
MSEAEAAFRGPDALRKHYARHGHPISASNPLTPPPDWFTAPMLTIWDDVLTTAPAGVLHQADYANLVVLVRAIHTHNTLSAAWLAYQTAEAPMLPPPDLERRARMAGAEVNRASQVLGLTARNGFTQPPEPSFDPFRRFVVVEPDAA